MLTTLSGLLITKFYKMIPKEKANELMSEFTKLNKGNRYFGDKYCNGIRGSSLCVKHIIIELNKLPIKDLSDLQYWGEVEHELSLL